MASATIAPSVPQMQVEFSQIERIDFLSKLLLTTPALFIAISSSFVGVLIKNWGRIRTLQVGLALYAVAGSTGLYMESFWGILVGRAILGTSVALLMTSVVTLVGDYYTGDERIKVMGLQGAFMSFGGLIYVMLGGFMADLHWRAPFALYLSAILVLLFTGRFLVEPSNPEKLEKVNWNVLKSARLVRLYIFTFISMIVFYSVPTQIPGLIKELGNKENFTAGLAIACSTAASTIVALKYAKLRKALNINQLFITMIVFLAGGFFMIYSASNLILIFAGLFVSGLGMGLMMPNTTNAALSKSTFSDRGSITGMVTAWIFMGQFFSPVALQPVKSNFDTSTTFLFAAFLILLTIPLFINYKLINKTQAKR